MGELIVRLCKAGAQHIQGQWRHLVVILGHCRAQPLARAASPCKGLPLLASLEAWLGAGAGLDLKAHPLLLSMTSATVDSQVVEGSMKFR